MRLCLDRHFKFSVAACAVFLGVLVSAPQWLHMIDSRYQGVPVHLNSDEYRYLERTQEVLDSGLGIRDSEFVIRDSGVGRLGVAIGGGEELPNLAPGLLEVVYGVVFRPFANRAATIFNWMDFIEPLLLFIVMVGFCRACGLSRGRALVAAVLFSTLELYNLGRPIHQRASFLLVLMAMWCLIQGLERRIAWGIVGGVIMGLLVGVYFWSWTAAWCWWGVLVVGSLARWLVSVNGRKLKGASRSPESKSQSQFLRLILFGAVGAIVALPFLWQMVAASRHLLYEEAFFRSGVGSSHVPESWPWTILFSAMAVVSIVMFVKRKQSMYVTCTIVTAFVLLNQHVVHGVRFLFASHYLFSLVFAAVLALVAMWKMRLSWAYIAFASAAIFLLGIAYDNRSIINQWRVHDGRFAEQHLATLLPILDALDRSTILSDPLTSAFVASHTHHDVVYANYIQNELRSHEEIAERYCLTQLPRLRSVADGSTRSTGSGQAELTAGVGSAVEFRPGLIYGSAYDAIDDPVEPVRTAWPPARTTLSGRGGREEMEEQERALIADTCERIAANPESSMAHVGVAYVLWDEKRRAEWDLRRLRVPLEIVEQGDEWSLLQVK